MFDIAFSELLVIGLVALIVIGPEKLPKLARTAGTWLGKLNRYVSQVKQDINRDMQLEELRKLQQEMRETAQKYEIMANETAQGIKREAEEVSGQVNKVMQAMAATDGGLAMREYEKIKSEAAAEGGAADKPASDAQPEPGEKADVEAWRDLNADIVPDDLAPREAVPAVAPDVDKKPA
jgi:sec-independent protein translocase protein TatB